MQVQDTMTDLRRVYMTAARLGEISASPKTARRNLQELYCILKTDGNYKPEEIRPGIVSRWKRNQYKLSGINEPIDALKNYRLNCRLRLAKSVFTAQTRKLYELHGIRLPDALEEIAHARPFKPEARQTFRPIEEDTDCRIREEARRILDSVPTESEAVKLEPLGAIMIEMARLCGMTAKEIHFFRKSWVLKTRNGYVIDIREDNYGFTTKHSSKNRQIPLSENVWLRWKKFLPQGDELLFGDWKKCTNPRSVYSKTNKWLSQFIPNRQKKLHELRKMACSEVLANERDIYAAAYYIGNRVDTTAKYYVAQMRHIRALE